MTGLLGSGSKSSIDELALLFTSGRISNNFRSEWLRKFEGWAGPASDTEDEKIKRTECMVKDAIIKELGYRYQKIKVFAQGSSVNNTNVKTVSDLDLVALVEEPAWYLPANGQHFPLGFIPTNQRMDSQYEAYRREVFIALLTHFSNSGVSFGKKCIKLDTTNSTRVSCDVVPAFRLRRHRAGFNSCFSSDSYDESIVFFDILGNMIESHPEQHLENGRAKNKRTGYRYKQVVRVLKKFATAVTPLQLLLTSDDSPSSFMIESMVYNVSDNLLTSGDLYQCVHATVNWLSTALESSYRTNAFRQVCEKADLFPYWGIPTLLTPYPRPNEVETCANFINRVKSNIGI